MKVDYIIIYGCHKKRILNERLNHLLKILNNYNYNNIVLTGGIGLFGKYNEALYMKDYLIKNKIDSNKLIIEDKSRTTKENNINVIDLLKLNEVKVKTNIVLVTNKFHMYRNRRIIKKLINNKNINFIYDIVGE